MHRRKKTSSEVWGVAESNIRVSTPSSLKKTTEKLKEDYLLRLQNLIKEPTESQWKPATQTPVNRAGRENYPSRYISQVGPGKEWRPKSTNSSVSHGAASSEVSTVFVGSHLVTQPTPVILSPSEDTLELQRKLDESHISHRHHVIIPNHIHVPTKKPSVGPGKEWRPKSTNSSSVSHGAASSEVSTVFVGNHPVTQPSPVILTGREAILELLRKLDESHISHKHHVIIPNHIHVPTKTPSGDSDDDVVFLGEFFPDPTKKLRLHSLKPSGDDDDDDCVILDGDPEKPVMVWNDGNDDSDDLVIVAEKGEFSCRDFCHSRHLCVKFPFASTPHRVHCSQCYCYACDSPAPCIHWGTSIASVDDHCHASDKNEYWRAYRKSHKEAR